MGPEILDTSNTTFYILILHQSDTLIEDTTFSFYQITPFTLMRLIFYTVAQKAISNALLSILLAHKCRKSLATFY